MKNSRFAGISPRSQGTGPNCERGTGELSSLPPLNCPQFHPWPTKFKTHTLWTCQLFIFKILHILLGNFSFKNLNGKIIYQISNSWRYSCWFLLPPPILLHEMGSIKVSIGTCIAQLHVQAQGFLLIQLQHKLLPIGSLSSVSLSWLAAALQG